MFLPISEVLFGPKSLKHSTIPNDCSIALIRGAVEQLIEALERRELEYLFRVEWCLDEDVLRFPYTAYLSPVKAELVKRYFVQRFCGIVQRADIWIPSKRWGIRIDDSLKLHAYQRWNHTVENPPFILDYGMMWEPLKLIPTELMQLLFNDIDFRRRYTALVADFDLNVLSRMEFPNRINLDGTKTYLEWAPGIFTHEVKSLASEYNIKLENGLF